MTGTRHSLIYRVRDGYRSLAQKHVQRAFIHRLAAREVRVARLEAVRLSSVTYHDYRTHSFVKSFGCAVSR